MVDIASAEIAASIAAARTPQPSPSVLLGVSHWANTVPDFYLPTFTDLKVSLSMNESGGEQSSMSCKLLESDADRVVAIGGNRRCDFYVRRDSVGIQRFRLKGMTHSGSEDGVYTLQIAAEDYASCWRENRPIETDAAAAPFAFYPNGYIVATPIEEIAYSLWYYVETQSHGPDNVALASDFPGHGGSAITPSITRGGTVVSTLNWPIALGTFVGEALDKLVALRGTVAEDYQVTGIEWGIDYDKKFHLYVPYRGVSLNSVKAQLSYPGNLQTYTVIDGSENYANAITQTGGQTAAGVDTTPVSKVAWGTEARADEGRWGKYFSNPEAKTQQQVEDSAKSHMAISAINSPAYQVELQRNGWGGRDHIDLGDYVGLTIRHGPLYIEVVVRVLSLSLTYNSDGTESVDLTLSRPVKGLRDLWKSMNRRIRHR